MRTIVITGCLLLLIGAVPCLQADRIATVTATTSMSAGPGFNLANTVNGAGLSSLSLTATHSQSSGGNAWASQPGIPTGIVTFDLGGAFWVDSFSFWNFNGTGGLPNSTTGIQGVAVYTSTNGVTFVPLPGGPTTFSQRAINGSFTPQIFNFTPVLATQFRFSILSNYGDTAGAGFSEVGFDAIPEPLTVALVASGLLSLAGLRRLRR